MPDMPDRPVVLTDETGAPVTTVPTGRTEKTATLLVYLLAAILVGVLIMQSILLLRITTNNQEDSQFRRDIRALILCGRDQQCVNDVINGIRVRAGITVNPPVTITTPGPTVTSIVVVPAPVRPSTTQGTTGSTRATVGAPVTATTTPSTSRTTSTTTTTAPPRPTTTTTAPSSPSTTTTTATPLFCVQGHCLS